MLRDSGGPCNVRSGADLQHVLVEKPISIDLETSRNVVQVAEAHPEIKVMVGFSRRCESADHLAPNRVYASDCIWAHICICLLIVDESYRETKRLIDEGALGAVHMIRSATNDQYDPSGKPICSLAYVA